MKKSISYLIVFVLIFTGASFKGNPKNENLNTKPTPRYAGEYVYITAKGAGMGTMGNFYISNVFFISYTKEFDDEWKKNRESAIKRFINKVYNDFDEKLTPNGVYISSNPRYGTVSKEDVEAKRLDALKERKKNPATSVIEITM